MRPIHVLTIIFAFSIPVLGYGIMHGAAEWLPLSEESTVTHFLLAIIILALALLVPYAFLKTGFFTAHKENRKEKELHLKDVPKDKEQIARQ